MKIAVIGTGYVGLVTGSCLAASGHTVVCIDNNESKVRDLKAGISPIFEDGLSALLESDIASESISFTTSIEEGVQDAEAIFLALPTPPGEDGSADLSAVLSVARQLGNFLPKNYCVVINKSTVPVGTADKVREAIAQNAITPFDVVSNPEFLREGLAIQDFMEPERIVVGVTSEAAETIMRTVYEPFLQKDTLFFVTDPATAELSKYAANTFLTTKINFMNEMAQLSELMGADVDSLRQIIGSDSRIGSKFLYPGIGAGGSCFPKDVRALKFMADEYNYQFRLIEAAIDVNQKQHLVLVDKVSDHFDGDLTGKTFGFWGLAFKPNTDDIRESPALHVLDALLERGATIKAYDPEAHANVRRKYAAMEGLTVLDDQYDVANDSDALIIATDWDHFKAPDLTRLQSLLREATIFDGRNMYSRSDMDDAGFSYYSIGRRPVINGK